MATRNITANKADDTFGDLPKGKLKRNLFNMKGSNITSFKIGELVPVLCEETLPGDLWSLGAEVACRFPPLYFPAMIDLHLTMHYFYVPNRICWDKWEEFITGETDLIYPTINLGAGVDALGNNQLVAESVGSHMGLPSRGDATNPVDITIDFAVSAIPFHAYAMIYDHYYRSSLIQPEIVDWELQQGVQIPTSGVYDICFNTPLRRTWSHDYLTSALPTPAAGENVLIPLLNPDNDFPLSFRDGADPTTSSPFPAIDARFLSTGVLGDGTNQAYLDSSTFNVFATDIYALRLATRLLEFYESTNRASFRYRDMMIAEYGIDPTPGVIDEPKYIGGTKGKVVIQDVMQTANTLTPSDDSIQSVVGDYGGQALALQGMKPFRFFAPEHGYIICIANVQPSRAQYFQGMHRKWTRQTRLDFAWNDFAHIGDQEVLNQEVIWNPFADGTPLPNDNAETFGYVPRYEEYRHGTNTISGIMRSQLLSWHFGRVFDIASMPALNSDFLECVPRTTDIFVKAGPSDPDIFALIQHNNMVYRNLPKFGIPGL